MGFIGTMLSRVWTVSYTHLDVYKRQERIRARRTPDPAYDAFFFGLHGQRQTFHLEAFRESGERTAVEGQFDGTRGRPLHVMRL